MLGSHDATVAALTGGVAGLSLHDRDPRETLSGLSTRDDPRAGPVERSQGPRRAVGARTPQVPGITYLYLSVLDPYIDRRFGLALHDHAVIASIL